MHSCPVSQLPGITVARYHSCPMSLARHAAPMRLDYALASNGLVGSCEGAVAQVSGMGGRWRGCPLAHPKHTTC